ncbi:MAG TPA: GNAT family N-acetyltransferase [Pseudothermotoga sp.]|nr:GNAT family N-acetyltransferase [Pseudothermotoga sp.]HOK83296.1 GNAT family N-acetyltransferase [Pseudothermotoga sp.]HPP70121.1 GNAT family N-acetyltransferase [Pseudothermotoga sp.]
MESVKLLAEFPIVRFLDLVNEIFSDYPVPINWDTLSFNLDARENSISLTDSFVFLKDDRPVGFIVCCLRKNRGRIDAMGVVKEERGTGLAYRILEHALESLRWKKAESVVLEVLETETRAIRFYEKNGFRTTRRLFSMVKENPVPVRKVSFFRADPRWIHQISVEAMINLSRHPNWQREPATLLLASSRYKMARTNLLKDQGYVVWGATEQNAFIVDCAPARNRESYVSLLDEAVNYVCDVENKTVCSMANIPEDDPLYNAALKIGFEKVLTQLEMVLHLY